MKSKNIKLSIVIPAFNEEVNFKRGVLDKIDDYLKKQRYFSEVILVNDGSTDQTLKLLRQFSKHHPIFKVIDIPHGGKMAAVRKGVEEAIGEIILFSDFDQSTPIQEVAKVIDQFKKGADVVIGERSSKDIERSWFHRLRGKLFNLAVQLIVLPGFSDTQCGFKAFRAGIGKSLFQKLKVTDYSQKSGYMGAFDVEILYLAKKNGFKIVTVPVSWTAYESGRLSASEPVKMLKDVALIKLMDLPSSGLLNKHFLPILLLFLLTIPAFLDAIAVGFFPMQDDLQVGRHLVMDKCFKDSQIPCRWSEDLGYGFGYPLFNFYPPLPYYIGQLVHWTGFSFTDTVKVMVILNFIVSGLTMYLLAQAFWGRWGGLISGLFYVYAPYHGVDIYVRAAINEAWALTWYPAIYWSLYKLITTRKWVYVIYSALFTSLLMLSHNPMLMIFAPTILMWCLFWLLASKNFKVIGKLVLSGIWALFLAAFFTLPVIFEQKYAHVETLVEGYFNYLAHFATLRQLFVDRFWGYGDSRFGPIDDISFQLGHLHWILTFLVLVLALVFFRKKRQVSLMVVMIFLITVFYTFLTHEKSSFIWSRIKTLEFLQFPWRALTVSIFGMSFLSGGIVMLFKFAKFDKLDNFVRLTKPTLLIGFLVVTVFFYKDYFRWREHWPWVDDKYKFSGELWRLQITSGIFDYLPIWATLPPPVPPNGNAEIISGSGKYQTEFKNSIVQKYKVQMDQPGIFQINTFYFPGWVYLVNGQNITVDPKEDQQQLGRPEIKLDKGDFEVIAKLTNTPIRVLGNGLSLLGWGIMTALLFYLLFTKLSKSLRKL